MRPSRSGTGSKRETAGTGTSTGWITYTAPAIRTSDLGPLIMIVGVFLGFMSAIHYADSPRIFNAVEYVNQYLSPIFAEKPAPVVPESEALVVTLDNKAVLSAVATLTPRGFHAVTAGSVQDALNLLRDSSRVWKLAVIDVSIPGYDQLPDALKGVIPAGNVIVVQGHQGTQAVSRALLERLDTLVL